MYKAFKFKGKIMVGKFEGERLLFLLRRGHEVQNDERGKGSPLVWKSTIGAKMYADLLNRGKAL